MRMRKHFVITGEVGGIATCEEPITAPGLLETVSAKLVGWWLKACFLEPEGLGSNPDHCCVTLDYLLDGSVP